MQRITRILLALLLATLAACNDPPPAAAKAVATDKEIPTANPTDDHHSREVFCEPSIHPFWKKFRAAVLAEDAEAVADMTHFPVAVSGKALSRAEFIKQFPRLLKVPPTDFSFLSKPNMTSMKEVIRNYPTLEKNACAPPGTLLHFDRWAFDLKPEGWRLELVETRTFQPYGPPYETPYDK